MLIGSYIARKSYTEYVTIYPAPFNNGPVILNALISHSVYCWDPEWWAYSESGSFYAILWLYILITMCKIYTIAKHISGKYTYA